MAEEPLPARLVRLTEEVDRVPDPEARRLAHDLAGAVLELHGEGIGRLFDMLDDEGRAKAAQDDVVGGLLLIHDLHPESLEDRVLEALDGVRPYMQSHGGDVQLLGIVDGVARLRLVGSCDGCAASSSTLELAVEKALREGAPDLDGMDVEGAAEPRVTGLELPMANGNGHAPVPDWTWLDLDAPAEDALVGVDVGASGEQLVIARAEGALLAYRDLCAACGSPLVEGELSEGVLACPGCARRFFLPRAGRSLDDERLQLQPIPLLEERDGRVRVALPL